MPSSRIDRINEDIQREISALLPTLKDPRIAGLVSVTGVETTSDLRYAKVFVSIYETEREKELLKGLKAAAGYLRRELGKAMTIRYTPELIFAIDDSIQRGAAISKLLNALETPENGEDKA